MTRLFVQCFDDERSENSGEFEGSEPYQTSKLINQSMIRKFKTFTLNFNSNLQTNYGICDQIQDLVIFWSFMTTRAGKKL